MIHTLKKMKLRLLDWGYEAAYLAVFPSPRARLKSEIRTISKLNLLPLSTNGINLFSGIRNAAHRATGRGAPPLRMKKMKENASAERPCFSRPSGGTAETVSITADTDLCAVDATHLSVPRGSQFLYSTFLPWSEAGSSVCQASGRPRAKEPVARPDV